ncbi:MAG: hypothetical protein KDC87_14515 [Planctomycetes bacterium]|nr:hypothetical protein [Planctomycetota bacterium]MCB9869292.1 hypothetical protein [Planctomycetota bacterium]
MIARRRGAVACWAFAAVLPGACAGPALTVPELKALCDSLRPPDAAVRLEARVSLATNLGSRFAGEFLGLAIARTSPSCAVRLQLFPELGGKVLDVVATPARRRGVMPPVSAEYDSAAASGDRLLEMFAVSLLLAHAPLQPEHVREAHWETPQRARLQLIPRFGADRCVLWIDRSRGEREFAAVARGAGWSMRVQPDGSVTIQAKGFRLSAAISAREALSSVADSTFELD